MFSELVVEQREEAPFHASIYPVLSTKFGLEPAATELIVTYLAFICIANSEYASISVE